MITALTAKNVLTLPPGTYTDKVWEGRGTLQLRVSESDVRSFSLMLRGHRHGLGRLEDQSLADVRAKAKALRREVEDGRLPARPKDALSLGSALDAYLEAGQTGRGMKQGPWAKGTIAERRRLFARLPESVKASPMASLTPARLKEAIAEATTGKVLQNRMLSSVKAAVRFSGRDTGVFSPVLLARRDWAEPSRARVLGPQEIKAVWLAASGSGSPQIERTASPKAAEHCALIRLLILLGTRVSETILMKQSCLQLEATPPVWSIPGQDRKGGRPHLVVLPPAAVEIIRGLLVPGRDRVFTISAQNRATWIKHLHDRAALPTPWVTHDIRRTVRSGLADLGFDTDLCELIIGHARTGIVGVYNLSQRLADRTAAMKAWADRVAAVVA